MTSWRAWPAALAAAALDPDEGDRRRDRLLLAAIAALALALRVWLLATTRLTDTAGLITLRFSENVAHGHGFVYNVGERVLGTTTPLFALIMAAGLAAGVPGMALAKTIGIAADVALVVVAAAWLRAMGYRRAGLVTAFLLALSPHGLHWSIAGMETTLVALCCVGALHAYARRREAAAFALLGVCALLRWDTLLLAGAITAGVVAFDRRLPARGMVAFALVVAPWAIFATLYFGSPLPVTWTAKAAVAERLGSGSEAHHLRAFVPLIVGQPWDKIVNAAALVGIVAAIAGRRRELGPAIAWTAALWAAFVISRAPITDRYVLPASPVQAALASIAVAAAARRAASWRPRPVLYAIGGAAALVLLWRARNDQRVFLVQQVYEDGRRAVGTWIRDHSDPGDLVLIATRSSIGTIGYYADRPVIDAKGIVTPAALAFWGPGHVSPDYDLATALRPRWVVARTDELPSIERGAAAAGKRWEDDYELAADFPPPVDEYHVYRRRGASSP